MFNIGGLEFLIILVVALVFLGPERLPGAARQAGKTLGALREMAQSFQTELQDAMNDPIEADARTAGAKAVTSDKAAKAAKADRSEVDSTASDDAALDTTSDAGTEDSVSAAADAEKGAPKDAAAGAAATAAHVAATTPDRSHKPLSGSVNGVGEADTSLGDATASEGASEGADEGASEGASEEDGDGDSASQDSAVDDMSSDVVPDPADLDFASAAPRFPRAEVASPEAEPTDSDLDETEVSRAAVATADEANVD